MEDMMNSLKIDCVQKNSNNDAGLPSIERKIPIKITDIHSPQFAESIRLYEHSFPPYETRATEKIKEMLRCDNNYHLFASLGIDNKVIGISLMYTFKDLGFGLLDYMAVTPDCQNKGIGTEIFKFTLDEFKSHIPNGIGLLLEIQKENIPDLEETERKKRVKRINFYKQLGVKNLEGVNYLLPPLQPNSQTEEMYMMIRPVMKTLYLSKESTTGVIDAIYSRIYEYKDGNLLDTVVHRIPEKIFLRDP
jgi:GNAT superfamily N-acetyltransferase